MKCTRQGWWLLAAGALLASCSNAGEDFGFGTSVTGQVGVFVFLDRDGSLSATGADTVLQGVAVGLVVSGTTDTAFKATTDATGNAIFNGIPLGDYRVAITQSTVGDSVQVQSIDSSLVTLRSNDPLQTVQVRVGFQSVTIAQARTLASGARVFIRGMLLASPDIYGDTTAYVTDGTVAIRLRNAADAGPQSNPGDSVRVLGTLTTFLGQPVMDTALINIFQFAGGQPPAVSLTTQQANTAAGGARDAELIQLSGAVITATNTVNGDLEVTVDDGSGPVVVVLDQDIAFQLATYVPGKTVNGKGILVPTGTGTWVVKPRFNGDMTAS